MKKLTSLTKTCLACATEKSLAAFLQISGTQGTVYGNICSSCRSDSARSKPILPKEDEDTGRGSAGLKIDSKTRVQQLIEQQKQTKKTKENIHQEDKKQERIVFDKTERKETKEKSEKSHREGYLEAKKKQGFLGSSAQKTQTLGTIPSQKSQIDSTIITEQQLIETQKQEAAIQQEQKLTSTDMTQSFRDTGESKYQSAGFKQFKDWLGTSANFRTVERLYKSADNAKKSDEKNENKKDPFTDYVEKTFKPSSRK